MSGEGVSWAIIAFTIVLFAAEPELLSVVVEYFSGATQ